MSERMNPGLAAEIGANDPRVVQLQERNRAEQRRIQELEQIQSDRIYVESSEMRQRAELLRSQAEGDSSKLAEADALDAQRIAIRDDAARQLGLLDETANRLDETYRAEMDALLKELGHSVDGTSQDFA